jgi:transketolase C-terminal domain/subunit
MPSRSWEWHGTPAQRSSWSRTITWAGLGSDLAEASAALAAPFTVQNLGVRRIPKSGRTAADVLDYLGLSVQEIAAVAERLARRQSA